VKIIDFKTVSPLFEMERDGEKPFTTRKIEKGDKRFRALSQWQPAYHWGIRITNPATGGSFIREIVNVSFLWHFNQSYNNKSHGLTALYDWRIIIMGAAL